MYHVAQNDQREGILQRCTRKDKHKGNTDHHTGNGVSHQGDGVYDSL